MRGTLLEDGVTHFVQTISNHSADLCVDGAGEEDKDRKKLSLCRENKHLQITIHVCNICGDRVRNREKLITYFVGDERDTDKHTRWNIQGPVRFQGGPGAWFLGLLLIISDCCRMGEFTWMK